MVYLKLVDGLPPGISIDILDYIAENKRGLLATADLCIGEVPVAYGSIPKFEEYGTHVLRSNRDRATYSILLFGRTPRTQKLVWEGKINFLLDNDIPGDVARVAATCPYGTELEVAKLAVVLKDAVLWSGPFQGGSQFAFERWAGGFLGNAKDQLLAFPKLQRAAAVIAAEVIARERRADAA